jgi:RND superfamily putative drug exporter
VGEPGAAQPLHVVVKAARGKAPAKSVRAVRRTLASDRAVERVERPRFAGDRGSALLVAVPRKSPEDDASKALVQRIRSKLPDVAAPASVAVGGGTAGLVDINHMINSSMWKIVVFVLGLSFLVLVFLLRSVVLPLKAVVMNLLSVGAAYGVLVAVFQWGWADGLFGYEAPGYVDWMTPPLVLAVVFGLSMDYEVFLLSRIRERYKATGDTTEAVTEGLASSARTITSAALIMVSVFAVFIGTGVESIKEIGLGNAVAIGIDATLVRLVLMPAAMKLFGEWNWWLPRPLARVLPPSPEPAVG